MVRHTVTLRARPRTLTRPTGRSPAPDTSPSMARSQVRGVPRPVARFPVPARSRARAVSPALTGQHQADLGPVDPHPADSGREDLPGRAEPPGPCQETALFPGTRRHRDTPPRAVSPGQAVTVGRGSRALTVPRASQVRTACKGRQVRTTGKASPATSARRDSRVRLKRRDNLVRLTLKGHRASSACRASRARTACKGFQVRMVRMVRKASPVSSAGQNSRPPMTRSSRRGRTEGTASLARPAPAKVRRYPPATHLRTSSSTARLAIRARAASSAQPARVAQPARATQPVQTAPEAGVATRGAQRRAGSPAPDRARTGTPTTGTRLRTRTARPSTAASTRT
jgi:hypothetical protein